MIEVSSQSWRQIFPKAPEAVIAAFAAGADDLVKAGVLAARTRLAYFCANVEHECDGFTIPNLTENINYTAARMAEVWPNRFSSAAAVQAKYGTASGWQKKAFDDIYGNRMGNRPGTHDGSTFIGRAGPQITGRDGYEAIGRLIGIDLVNRPTLATDPALQPRICAAFWTWKGMNAFADRDDFIGCVKAWNGGTNGLADRRTRMAGNDPIIARLMVARDVTHSVNEIESPASLAVAPIAGDIEGLQSALNVLGASPKLNTDGIYGSKTKDAVKAFQAASHLYVDGIAGPKTLAAIAGALSLVPIPEPKPPPAQAPQPSTQPPPSGGFFVSVLNLFRRTT